MTTLLALETSADACSLALCVGDRELSRHEILPRSHTQFILPMVNELLSQAGLGLQDIDAIAFGKGPGSFTGLRVCASVAQGLALGIDCPVIPVSSLQAMAQTAINQYQPATGTEIFCCIDARMDEVYWAHYQLQSNALVTLTGKESLASPDQVIWPQRPSVLAVGSGWVYAPRMPSYAGDYNLTVLPEAVAVLQLAREAWQQGNLLPPEQAVPTYLRDEVAWKKG